VLTDVRAAISASLMKLHVKGRQRGPGRPSLTRLFISNGLAGFAA
jgi:hypothetical protein